MSNFFKYSILRYVHSDLLGEVLNIGILFLFPDENKVVFKYPTTLARIRSAYENKFSDNLVHGILKGISRKVDRLYPPLENLNQATLNMFPGFDPFDDDFVQRILTPDSTALRFDKLKFAVKYDGSKHIVKDYYDLLFSHFNETQPEVRQNEEYISRHLKSSLQKLDPEYSRYIRKDREISVPVLPDGKFLFEFSWQNHVEHLVKPVAFDLLESKSINQKAATYYGYLSALGPELSNQKLDIITTRPQDKKLWSVYDKAISMISSTDIHPNIIEQGDIESYAEEIVQNVEKE